MVPLFIALVILIAFVVLFILAIILDSDFGKPVTQIVNETVTDYMHSRKVFDMIGEIVYNESAKIYAQKGIPIVSREEYAKRMEKVWQGRQKVAITKSSWKPN